LFFRIGKYVLVVFKLEKETSFIQLIQRQPTIVVMGMFVKPVWEILLL